MSHLPLARSGWSRALATITVLTGSSLLLSACGSAEFCHRYKLELPDGHTGELPPAHVRAVSDRGGADSENLTPTGLAAHLSGQWGTFSCSTPVDPSIVETFEVVAWLDMDGSDEEVCALSATDPQACMPGPDDPVARTSFQVGGSAPSHQVITLKLALP